MVAKTHNAKCKCAACAGVDVEKWQNEMMEKYGWYVHFVFDSFGLHNFNAHTHGLFETYGHLDLEISFPFNDEDQASHISHDIFRVIVDRIVAGESFSSKQRVSKIIENFDVIFFETHDSHRPLLRVILPEDDGNLDPDTLTDLFKRQYLI